jgi:hypothetical protein
MASKGKPQFVKNIFLQQSKGGLAAAGDASVWQDKARFARNRAGTAQPEPLTKNTREHRLNSKLPRSQNSPIRTKRTKKLTLWVEPIVKEELERIAKREGLSLSKSGAAFLKRSLQQQVDLAYSALLTPIIEAAIDRRMRARDSRLAWLLVRIGFVSEQTRALVTNILGRQQGMTEETLKNILAMSQRSAKGNITRTSPDLREIMNTLEEWLLSRDGKQESQAA